MNCMNAIEILDRMIFEEIPEDAGLRQHLDTCPSCRRAYTDALKAREVMKVVRCSEPLLRDPDGLTSDIMAGLEKGPAKTYIVPPLLTRMLTAASVVIFLLFGYEQYGIVKKISALESQCAAVKPGSRYPDMRQLASKINVSQAGIPFSEIERLLSTRKGRTALFTSLIKKQPDQRDKK